MSALPVMPPDRCRMARQLRLHVPDGFYHVTLRGNHRQPIFFSERDRDLLDAVVAEVTTKLSARVHAYCWMTNHLHMLVQVSDAPLGKIILQIASRYARTVQSSLATTGHFFERRYHCILVDADNYLITLVRYIHMNPVRGGLVTDPTAYRWSSHRVYLGKREQSWVITDFVMKLLAADPVRAFAAYRDLMSSDDPCRWGEGSPATNPVHKQILGDDEFVAKVRGQTAKHRSRVRSLDELVIECGVRFGYSPELLVSHNKTRGLAAARAWISHEAVAARVATICAVARRLDRCESAIRQLMARYPRNETSN